MTRILIADDLTESRHVLKALLEGNGFVVAQARDGAEALALARSAPPDLVVSDLHMPVMDGFELCRLWKRDESLKRIPFVVYTATCTDPQDERLALSLGADRFLVKPQPVEGLVGAVRDVLAGAAASPPPRSERDDLELERARGRALTRLLEKKVRLLELRNRELAASEEHFRALLENASDVLTEIDAAGVIRMQGPSSQRLLGYPLEEVVGRPVTEWIHPDDLPQAVAAIQGALAAPELPMTVECRLRHKDGSWRTFESIGRLVLSPAGDPVIVVNSRDVTERNRLEAQLVTSERMASMGTLAAGVAHEINNPLTAVIANLDLAAHDIDDLAGLSALVAERLR